MVIYEDKKDCSGCNACFNICPKDVIDMVEDEKGFKYPKINDNKCINCSLCVKVCPLKYKLDKLEQVGVYAIKNKDEKIRAISSSGGFFNALSDYVINNGGYVFGAAYDENFDVYHMGTNSLSESQKFKGSKYVKSDTNTTYKEVKELLKNNKLVLYSGTPCQIHGLKMYLGKINQDNLITCDNVCHGTPSPKIFREYKEELETKYNSKIKDFTFRYKMDNTTQNIYALFENGQRYIAKSYIDKYYKLFSYNINMRDCCFSCHYSNTNRVADFSMGDFWGIEKSIKNFDDGKGVSLVLLNNMKSKLIFDIIKNEFEVIESNIDDALQPNLMYPTIPSKNKDKFWNSYINKGYKYSSNKFTKTSIKSRIKSLIKWILIKLGIFNTIKGSVN